MNATDPPAATHWRAWLPFAAVALVYAVVATHRINLPGIFADAINPDYLVARILSPDPQRSITWVLFGNSLLGDRAPVLISLYHGSQQFWLGLPPIAFAAWRWTRGVALPRPPLATWTLGLATGGAAYPIGYLLIARKLGSFSEMVAFVRETQTKLGAFESVQPIGARLWHAWRTIDATVSNAWHSGIMFGGEMLATPGAGWKIAVVVGLPYALWLHAELRRRATPLLRLLVALPLSFVALSLIFGNRLGGHHFVTLVPLFYAALGLGLWTFVARDPRRTLVAAMVPIVLLGSVNVAGQVQMSDKLAETRGRGFLSDAIHRFAADLNAMPEKPFLWFPDAVLALPVIILTRASVPITDHMDDPEPRRTLCAGRDVAMVRIKDHPSEARAREWHANLGWDAPTIRPYAQADGIVVFEVLTYHGRRDGPGCTAAATMTNSPGIR